MSTITTERPTTEQPIATWVCPNCHAQTGTSRKRCTDCKTSRY